MENFKPFKGRTVSIGQVVDASYRKDGFITLREPETEITLGKCSSITLKDATFYKGNGFYIRGSMTDYKLQAPNAADYERLKYAVNAGEMTKQDIDVVKYIKLDYHYQITTE